MSAPTITSLPAAPALNDPPATFDLKAAAFAGALPTFGTETNAVGAYVEGALVTVDAGTAAATAAIAAANFQGDWSSVTTYSTGQSVLYTGVVYLSRVDSNLNNQPDISPDEWLPIPKVAIDFQEFTSSGTWTKPSGASLVFFDIQAPGGGGGSGRRGSASTQRNGGLAGGGGGRYLAQLPASAFSASETVVVGAPGSGGAAVTTDNTSGNSGSAGGECSLGSFTAQGGGGGPGGATANQTVPAFGGGIMGSAGVGGNFFAYTITQGHQGSTLATYAAYLGAAGAPVNSSDVAGGGNSIIAGSGGGAGAMLNSSNVVVGPRRSGTSPGEYVAYSPFAGDVENANGTAGGTVDGESGADATVDRYGGGGGYSGVATAAGAGGDGLTGGGAGGGGASLNGFDSGAGGQGGAGYVRIWTITSA